MIDLFYKLLVPMTLAGSLACAVLLAARPALRRLAARWHKAALVGACALYLVPLPLLLHLMPAATGDGGEATVAALPQTLGTAAPTAPIYAAGQAMAGALEAPAATATPQAAGIDWMAAIALVYFAGAIVCTVLAAVRYARFTRQVMRCSVPLTGTVHAQYLALCSEMGVQNPPLLCESENVRSPLLVGLVHPRILLPADMPQDETLAYALRHELTHHRQHDIPLKLLALCTGVVYWFNPLAHQLRREMGEACEASCDEAVAKGLDGEGRKAYAMALLAQSAAPQYALAAGFASPAKKLKKRLARLVRPVHPSRAVKTTALLCLSALALAGVLAGCSLAAGALEAPFEEGTTSLPENSGTLPETTSLPEDSSTPPSSAAASSEVSLPRGEANSETSIVDTLGAGIDENFDGSFIWPVPDYSYCFRGYSAEYHPAQDINASTGTDILAAAGGTVTASGWHPSKGYHIVIDHGNGYETEYTHCSELYSKAGDIVEQGYIIAAVGNTGNSSGPHLHFEVMLDGVRQNPLEYVTMP